VTLLFLNPTGQIGGAEAALLEILVGLREQQPAWQLVLVVASNGPLAGRAHALGVEVIVLPYPSVLARLGEWGRRDGFWSRVVLAAGCARAVVPAVAYLRQLRRMVRDHAPDIVHTNGVKMHVLGAWARPSRGVLVWHVHDYASRRPLTAWLLGRYARSCAMIVTNSQSVADDLRQVCGDRVPIQPIWNAVDLTQFSPIGPRLDLDELSGLPTAGTTVVRVGLVATCARWKGHQIFLSALERLSLSTPVRGYVIGGPLYETEASQVSLEELRNEADRLGVGSRVGFTGFVGNPALAIRSLDVVVHASTEPEPFGLVIAEAMACGKPVVVSETGGAAEIITSGVDALTYMPGDADGLARRIEELVNDEGLRQAIGSAGRATAERAFTRRRLVGELVATYQGLSLPKSQVSRLKSEKDTSSKTN
jgi:glycosyltransferase involved in cell wall biosynthesis